MAAVTVFRWDDVGAPSLVGRKPSDILAIIQACLVDGYGTKTPLGWTKEFEDIGAIQAAYRNNVGAGGSGGYVKFYDGSGGDIAGQVLRFKSSMVMTDINNQVNEGYQSAISANYSNSTNWVLIGTPTAFYLIIKEPTINMGLRRNLSECAIFCGDFKPYIPNDACRFIATGTPNFAGDFTPIQLNSYSYMFSYQCARRSNYGYTNCCKLPATDGSCALVDYGFLDGNHAFDEYVRNRTGQKKGIFIPTIVGVRGADPSNYTSTDPDGVLYNDSVKWPLWRGELPGLVTEGFCHLEQADWPHSETMLGAEHWAMSSSGCTITVWINMEDWS